MKNHYYIGVYVNAEVKLVTSVDNKTHTVELASDAEPVSLPASVAENVIDGLLTNGIIAFLVKSKIQFERNFINGGV